MNRYVNTIANRLSLRQPQRDSLEILARVCEIIELGKSSDVPKQLEIIRSEFTSVTDFEREFPSLCFALATGVGKTRLMGAFIAYLFQAEQVRHFFVLAPNLTIYNKLITDFTPNTPKYVFQGIADFANRPPEIITGDNYESGRGVRAEYGGQHLLFDDAPVHVNIFNISKINSEVRSGSAPRIKRLSEYIGDSYFDYLSKLDDLVLLMDESHRYRATAGARAINELRPILGLELTATPQVEKGNTPVRFNNVILSYPLSVALTDGFIKQPAVATRENFRAENYDEDALERLKLEDGVRVHEECKVQLEVYARENGVRRVKPFMLVVARDTEHANALAMTIDVPKIVVVPTGEVTCGFKDFDLDARGIRLQPVPQDILIQTLRENERYRLTMVSAVGEERLEDYLVRGLIDYDDICYDEHAKLLYKLTGQMVAHLRSYLPDEAALLNVLQAHNRQLVRTIYAQMQEHFVQDATEYEVHVSKGFTTLTPSTFLAQEGEEPRDFRTPVDEKRMIRGMLFTGFEKCLYPIQKFDSDPERRFGVVLENDGDVLKWLKPNKGVFRIHYEEESEYEPDFVVETPTTRYLCEPKMESEMGDETVQAKARAATTWCRHATTVADKPWKYLLIPHTVITEASTLAGLAAGHTFERDDRYDQQRRDP